MDFKKVLAIQLTYQVSSEEKEKANKILLYLDALLKKITESVDHLDLIYTPFKQNPNITPEEAYKARAALRRYRDKVVDNFNIFKRLSFKCYALMQYFAVDTQIIKLSKSFVMSIEDIQKQVNRLVDLFANLESPDFAKNVVKAIENVKKEAAQFEQIVDDRIRKHIQNNILAITWVDNVSEELQEKIEQRMPESVKLVEERNK